MTSSIIVRCPTCKARIKAPTEIIGQTRACPGCGRPFLVPTQAPGDAGPTLLLDAAALDNGSSPVARQGRRAAAAVAGPGRGR
jgi:hypothetical protein